MWFKKADFKKNSLGKVDPIRKDPDPDQGVVDESKIEDKKNRI